VVESWPGSNGSAYHGHPWPRLPFANARVKQNNGILKLDGGDGNLPDKQLGTKAVRDAGKERQIQKIRLPSDEGI
jgi:hypothetical protein